MPHHWLFTSATYMRATCWGNTRQAAEAAISPGSNDIYLISLMYRLQLRVRQRDYETTSIFVMVTHSVAYVLSLT